MCSDPAGDTVVGFLGRGGQLAPRHQLKEMWERCKLRQLGPGLRPLLIFFFLNLQTACGDNNV